jgi:hypothetical protein
MGDTTVTAETNKIVMHRFLEFINTASEMLAQELISPNAIFHVPGSPEPMRGPAGYLAIIGMMRGGFPDIRCSVIFQNMSTVGLSPLSTWPTAGW